MQVPIAETCIEAVNALLAERGHAWRVSPRRIHRPEPFDPAHAAEFSIDAPPGHAVVIDPSGGVSHHLKIDWSRRALTIEEVSDKGSDWATIVTEPIDAAWWARFSKLDWIYN